MGTVSFREGSSSVLRLHPTVLFMASFGASRWWRDWLPSTAAVHLRSWEDGGSLGSQWWNQKNCQVICSKERDILITNSILGMFLKTSGHDLVCTICSKKNLQFFWGFSLTQALEIPNKIKPKVSKCQVCAKRLPAHSQEWKTIQEIGVGRFGGIVESCKRTKHIQTPKIKLLEGWMRMRRFLTFPWMLRTGLLPGLVLVVWCSRFETSPLETINGTVQDMEKLENLTTEASLATFKSDAMGTGHWVLDGFWDIETNRLGGWRSTTTDLFWKESSLDKIARKQWFQAVHFLREKPCQHGCLQVLLSEGCPSRYTSGGPS